jgi:flagellar biosynthetic protein FliP
MQPRRRTKIFLLLAVSVFLLLSLSGCIGSDNISAPGVSLNIGESDSPQEISSGVQLLVIMTVLSVAPSILILATSFTRIIIVLSMIRSAIGTSNIPPNQVVVGLALLLTFFIMTPVYNQVNEQALQPFLAGEIDTETAFTEALSPVREFMFKQTREKDIQLFIDLSGSEQPETLEDIPTNVLLPGFVISELRTAFMMGFFIYVPFLVIDMVISSILLSMGMMMLPPSLISLPFKILLFVLVDGWYLIIRSLAQSFVM